MGDGSDTVTAHSTPDTLDSTGTNVDSRPGRRYVSYGRGLRQPSSLACQYLKAGLLDEILISLIPILLGNGIRLFEVAT
jgi:dihydrofolate reductase